MTTASSRTGQLPAAEPLTLASFLPYRLNVLASVVSDGLARRYGERFGIGVPEWRVLATVGEFRSITATAIGQHAHMGKVKVSRAAAALEARGLIRRHLNVGDRREAFLTLTPAGDALHGQIVPLAQDYVARLTAGLGGADAAALDRVLDALLASARLLTADP